MQTERMKFQETLSRLRDNTISVDTDVVRRKTKDHRVKVVRISMSRRQDAKGGFDGCFGIIGESSDGEFPWLRDNVTERIAKARNSLLPVEHRFCTVLSADIVR